MLTNDNHSQKRSETPPNVDAHGQAALLLVESLIHGLCKNATLDTAQAIDIAERAVEVQADQTDAADGDAAPMWRSHQLLIAITASLKVDEEAPTPLRQSDVGEVGLSPRATCSLSKTNGELPIILPISLSKREPRRSRQRAPRKKL